MRKNKDIYLFSLFVVLFDQIIKQVIVKTISYNNPVFVFRSFFAIRYTKNYGAAFSILTDQVNFLIVITIISLVLIDIFFLKDKVKDNIERMSYIFIIGGILGNLIDRIYLGYVIDYISVYFKQYHFPIFNFADVFIVIGIIILFVDVIRSNKNEKINK